MKKKYAVACRLSRQSVECGMAFVTSSMTLSEIYAEDETGARGAGMARAWELKPGFSIDDVLVMEVDPQPLDSNEPPS